MSNTVLPEACTAVQDEEALLLKKDNVSNKDMLAKQAWRVLRDIPDIGDYADNDLVDILHQAGLRRENGDKISRSQVGHMKVHWAGYQKTPKAVLDEKRALNAWNLLKDRPDIHAYSDLKIISILNAAGIQGSNKSPINPLTLKQMKVFWPDYKAAPPVTVSAKEQSAQAAWSVLKNVPGINFYTDKQILSHLNTHNIIGRKIDKHVLKKMKPFWQGYKKEKRPSQHEELAAKAWTILSKMPNLDAYSDTEIVSKLMKAGLRGINKGRIDATHVQAMKAFWPNYAQTPKNSLDEQRALQAWNIIKTVPDITTYLDKEIIDLLNTAGLRGHRKAKINVPTLRNMKTFWTDYKDVAPLSVRKKQAIERAHRSNKNKLLGKKKKLSPEFFNKRIKEDTLRKMNLLWENRQALKDASDLGNAPPVTQSNIQASIAEKDARCQFSYAVWLAVKHLPDIENYSNKMIADLLNKDDVEASLHTKITPQLVNQMRDYWIEFQNDKTEKTGSQEPLNAFKRNRDPVCDTLQDKKSVKADVAETAWTMLQEQPDSGSYTDEEIIRFLNTNGLCHKPVGKAAVRYMRAYWKKNIPAVTENGDHSHPDVSFEENQIAHSKESLYVAYQSTQTVTCETLIKHKSKHYDKDFSNH